MKMKLGIIHLTIDDSDDNYTDDDGGVMVAVLVFMYVFVV